MRPRPEVVAHRGLPTRFPDNTLPGLLAGASFADVVEVDVRRAGDGKLVLSHDAVLAGFEVSATPWSVLGEADLGDGHRPVLLEEALAALPGTPFQLEVKNLPFESGYEPDHRLALEAAERARPGDAVTSFNHDSLAAVRRVFPEQPTGLCLPGWGDMVAAIRLCHDAGHPLLVPSVEHGNEALAAAVEAGLRVYPWVTDDPDRVGELVLIGVAGIITDDPASVRALVDGKP